MRTIKYHLEWADCYPFWDEEGDNLPTTVLGLSTTLQKEVDDLNDYYQSLYNEDEPQESGFPNLDAAKLFAGRIIKSAAEVQRELTGQYNIIFKDTYWKAILQKDGVADAA